MTTNFSAPSALVAGSTSDAPTVNAIFQKIIDEGNAHLSAADGHTPPTGFWNMAGFGVNNIARGTLTTHSAQYQQLGWELLGAHTIVNGETFISIMSGSIFPQLANYSQLQVWFFMLSTSAAADNDLYFRASFDNSTFDTTSSNSYGIINYNSNDGTVTLFNSSTTGGAIISARGINLDTAMICGTVNIQQSSTRAARYSAFVSHIAVGAPAGRSLVTIVGKLGTTGLIEGLGFVSQNNAAFKSGQFTVCGMRS